MATSAVTWEVYGENASYNDENDMKAGVRKGTLHRVRRNSFCGQVEATSPLDPTNPYAASKAAAEMMATWNRYRSQVEDQMEAEDFADVGITFDIF